jgi:hypothetical protein
LLHRNSFPVEILPSDLVQVAMMTTYKRKTKRGTMNKCTCMVTAKKSFTKASSLRKASAEYSVHFTTHRDFSKDLKK